MAVNFKVCLLNTVIVLQTGNILNQGSMSKGMVLLQSCGHVYTWPGVTHLALQMEHFGSVSSLKLWI